MRKLLLLAALLFATPALAQTAGVYNVRTFGAIGNSADASTNIQAAVTAAPAGSTVLIPAGTYLISNTITLPVSIKLNIYGTLKPYSNPASQKPMISITGDNVTIDCGGVGGFDGISTTYKNFDAIYAFGPAAAAVNLPGYLLRPRVLNCNFQNMGLQSSASSTVMFQGTDRAEFSNITASNIGKTDAFVNSSGPFFFYGEFNRDLLIENVTADYVGNTFINNGASLNTVIRNTTGKNCTLFCYKGGFGGPATAITADITPSTTGNQTLFSVPNTAYTKARFARGMGFINVSATGTLPLPRGTVESQGDYGTYLAITTMQPMSVTPTIGDAMLEVETGTLYDGPKGYYSGLDLFDINIAQDMTIRNAYVRGAGMLIISGSTYGLGGGLVIPAIWIGADPYAANSFVNSQGITITGADIEKTYGSGIQIDGGTSNVVIDDYRIEDIGVGTDLTGTSAPVSYAISSNKYGTHRSFNVAIGKGVINTNRGGGVLMSYSTTNSLIGAMIKAPTGVSLYANNVVILANNFITATGALDGVYGVLLSAAGSANSSIDFFNNSIGMTATTITGGATTGWGIHSTDAGLQYTYVHPGNSITGAITSGTFTTVGGSGTFTYTNQALP